MANFAVAAPEEVISKGNEILERMANPHEKKGETLSRAFDLLAAQLDGEVIREAGVDIQALDAALTNIRNQFLAAVSGKNEITAQKDTQILEIRNAKIRAEEELKQKTEEVLSIKKEAEAAASIAKEEAERNRQEIDRLAGAVECIGTIKARLKEAEVKESNYDALKKEKESCEDQLKALEQKLRDQDIGFHQQTELLKKDHEARIREMQAQMDRMVSDTQKDAALKQAQALAAREKELSEQAADKYHELERENIRLQMENESLKKRNRDAESDQEEEADKKQNYPRIRITSMK